MFDSYADIFSERAGLYHEAMAAFPQARTAEFEAMIAPLGGREVASVCDMPAGGGYLAAFLPPSWRYVAVEPTDAFAGLCELGEGQELVRSTLTEVPRPDSSFDAVISLAGLHHEHDKAAILREVARLLRPGGAAVIADVAEGSKEGRFLNGFVDAHSELGHRGEFLDADFAPAARRSGLDVVSDEIVATPWRFDDCRQAAQFAGKLFGVSASLEDVLQALESIVGVTETDGGVEIGWSLRRLVCVRRAGDAAA